MNVLIMMKIMDRLLVRFFSLYLVIFMEFRVGVILEERVFIFINILVIRSFKLRVCNFLYKMEKLVYFIFSMIKKVIIFVYKWVFKYERNIE